MKIGKLEVICEKNNSVIYKEILNNNFYCLKKYQINDSCNLDMMIKSYNNYKNLKNKEGLIKIYDFWNENNIVFIRMEYLEGYITFAEWQKQKKNSEIPIKKIIKILNNLLIENCIAPDCGDSNFLINEQQDVKLIDLDLLNNYDIPSLSFLGRIYRSLFHRLNYCQKL